MFNRSPDGVSRRFLIVGETKIYQNTQVTKQQLKLTVCPGELAPKEQTLDLSITKVIVSVLWDAQA